MPCIIPPRLVAQHAALTLDQLKKHSGPSLLARILLVVKYHLLSDHLLQGVIESDGHAAIHYLLASILEFYSVSQGLAHEFQALR